MGWLACCTALILVTGCILQRPPEPNGHGAANAAINARVRAALLEDPIMQGFFVRVRAMEGIVRLDGEVDTPDQRTRAEELVRRIEGVRDVRNHLAVRLEPG